ncbi:MAG: serine/threonine-protein kinase, partial [Verrucomicrobiota bacterium]
MKERYEIREKIGHGGMGSVFRAFDTRMNREVAIKRIRQEGEDHIQQEAAQQIVKEAGALASLQHPNIVTIYDVGTDADGPYVVMELITGKTLDELIERAPLTWPDFRELALQTQEALIAAQELNLVHRDLKPGNLMLTWLPSGKFQVKIVDFGLAYLAEATTLDNLEQSDTVYGSIFFMCPEQFERAKLDARADMYSIGCVYYHALTGVYPFDGDTGMAVMTAHLHHLVTPLQEARPDLPRWACDWVMWHMNRNASDRPHNAREALKVFLQNANVPPQAMSTEPTPPAPRQPQ